MKNKILVLLILQLSGFLLVAQEKAKKPDKWVIKNAVHSINKAIQENYVYPDKAILITNFLNKQYNSGKYDQIASFKDFADNLTTDIRFIQNDRHLRIEYNPKLEQDIIRFNNSHELLPVV